MIWDPNCLYGMKMMLPLITWGGVEAEILRNLAWQVTTVAAMVNVSFFGPLPAGASHAMLSLLIAQFADNVLA